MPILSFKFLWLVLNLLLGAASLVAHGKKGRLDDENLKENKFRKQRPSTTSHMTIIFTIMHAHIIVWRFCCVFMQPIYYFTLKYSGA